MKKYILIAICLLCASVSRAQQFFIKGGLGYAMPMAGQSLDGTGTPYNGRVTNTAAGADYNYKNNASFSAGLSGTVGGGYLFNDHIGLELDLTTGLAPKKYTGNINNQVVDSIPFNIADKQYANTYVLLAPQLVVQTGGKVWNLYARGGVVVPITAHTTSEQTLVNLPGSGAVEPIVSTFDNKTSFSLGVTAAIGVQYNITDNVCLWGELNMLSMSFYLKESDMTGETVDGQSVSLAGGQNTYPYSNHFSYTQTGNTSPSYSIPFSNIGLHAGIMYKFDKSNRAKSTSRPSHNKSNGRSNGRDNIF